jgi:entericidin A
MGAFGSYPARVRGIGGNVRHAPRWRRTMKRLTAATLLALFAMSMLAACNTTRGFGRDLQKVGEKMEEAADDTGATQPR